MLSTVVAEVSPMKFASVAPPFVAETRVFNLRTMFDDRNFLIIPVDLNHVDIDD